MVRKIIAFVLFVVMMSCSTQPFSEYKDGTYIGEAKGKRRHLKVEITIENSRMTECRIIEHYEGAYYAKEPVEEIPRRILEAQDHRVDVVSGSTLTSQGIMDAVENALEKARK